MRICEFCGRECKNIRSYAGHIGNMHSGKQQSQFMKNLWKERKEKIPEEILRKTYWTGHNPPNRKGIVSKRKGRTYEEMCGFEKAKELKEKLKSCNNARWAVWHLTNQRKQYIHKTKTPLSSYGQDMLYKIIKEKYSDSIKNYCYKIEKKRYYIDIFIPSLNIGIEYNGCYYHGCPIHYPKKQKEYNQTMWRLQELINSGLNVISLQACIVKDENKMNNWFSFVENIIKEKGVLYGRTNCESIS